MPKSDMKVQNSILETVDLCPDLSFLCGLIDTTIFVSSSIVCKACANFLCLTVGSCCSALGGRAHKI